MMTRTPKLRRARRGSALATTLTLMFAMGIMGAGILSLVSGSMKMAEHRGDTTEALNMADGGVDLAVFWLSQQSQPPLGADLQFPGSNFYGTNGTLAHPFSTTNDGSSLTVKIDWDTTNPGATQKHYLVESTATTASGITSTVRAYVQQTSFGKYAYFLDKWASNGYWVSDLSQFDGPMHCNNSDGVAANILWKNHNGVAPIWNSTDSDAFTTTIPTKWNLNSIGAMTAPSSDADWYDVCKGGRTSVQDGTDSGIPLPVANTTQHDAALGPTTTQAGATAATGVTVPSVAGTTNGGLYIHGDIQQMTLSALNDSSGNPTIQQIVIAQTDALSHPYTTTITINPQTDQTTEQIQYVKADGTTATKPATGSPFNGLTNGAVYCDGNIGNQGTGVSGNTGKSGGLTGTIADNYVVGSVLQHSNALTIASQFTNPANLADPNNKSINICGSLTFATPRATQTNIPLNSGTLGIVTTDVEVMEKDRSGTALTNVEVDADVVAEHTYDAINYTGRTAHDSSGNPCKFVNYGGYVAENFGFFGRMDLSGTLLQGFNPTFTYDTRMANRPPPYFPTTGNHYGVLSWQHVTGTL